MLLSKKTLCALEAVLDIALHAQEGSQTCAALTARQKIARRYLERILQDLVRGGILAGLRGPRGGYHLARERRHISLGDIVRCLDENLEENQTQKTQAPVSTLRQEVLMPACLAVTADMLTPLNKITIEDLSQKVKKNAIIKTPQTPSTNFTI